MLQYGIISTNAKAEKNRNLDFERKKTYYGFFFQNLNFYFFPALVFVDILLYCNIVLFSYDRISLKFPFNFPDYDSNSYNFTCLENLNAVFLLIWWLKLSHFPWGFHLVQTEVCQPKRSINLISSLNITIVILILLFPTFQECLP